MVKVLPFVLVLTIIAPVLAASSGDAPAPKTPAEAIEAFSIAPGLEIRLLASEPIVQQPVCITFDDLIAPATAQARYGRGDSHPHGLAPAFIGGFL